MGVCSSPDRRHDISCAKIQSRREEMLSCMLLQVQSTITIAARSPEVTSGALPTKPLKQLSWMSRTQCQGSERSTSTTHHNLPGHIVGLHHLSGSVQH